MKSRAKPRNPVLMAVGMAAALAVIASAETARPPADSSPIGDIVSPSTIGEVIFPHSLHTEELGFDCSDCHHETDATRLRMPHEEYFEDFWIECEACHRENDSPSAPRSCADCHHSSPASTADETLSAKVVIHQSCWECHEGGTGVEASRSCGFCHTGRRSPAQEGP